MSDPGPGRLDGAEGVARRTGSVIAGVELQDDRQQQYTSMPIAGSAEMGQKPGRITGEVLIRFIEIDDDDQGLGDELATRARSERSATDIVIDIELDDGTDLPGCRVGGCWGAGPGPIGTLWFSLGVP